MLLDNNDDVWGHQPKQHISVSERKVFENIKTLRQEDISEK
jgi:hypothetical protein